jgi:RNA polymerase sigma-70 factor (ECF subfamily)
MEHVDQQLINGLQKGDLNAFEELYRQYYVFLCLISEKMVRDPADAKEIVSDVFVRLWNIREKIEINTSVKGYLIKAVRNTSLNYLGQKRQDSKLTDRLDDSDYQLYAWSSDYPLGLLFEEEARKILDQSIDSLPAACREIFLLSRNEELKYCEIAEKLGISVNTVKTQLKIALSRLREALKEYLLILIFILLL